MRGRTVLCFVLAPKHVFKHALLLLDFVVALAVVGVVVVG